MNDPHNHCVWGSKSQVEMDYHDTRWCKPIHDDNELFAMLCLEGMQAGLSWRTILNKEKDIREAFDNFDISKILRYDDSKINDLMNNKKIVRNKLKIKSVIKNATAFLEIQKEFKTFDNYIWLFTDHKTIVHHPKRIENMTIKNDVSFEVSKDLKKRGFSFVGDVIVYTYMQAIGIFNDHLDGCPWK